MEALLLERKRSPPANFKGVPWSSALDSRVGEALLPTTATPEELRKQTALDWNLERESSVFNGNKKTLQGESY